jgi:hypothetical protein
MEMQHEQNDKALFEDKNLVESLLGKEALNAFEAKQNLAPSDYFENFENDILKNVNKTKHRASIFSISKYGKLAIAASLLTIATTAYIFIQSNKQEDGNLVNINLQDLPTAEIDNYVDANELVTDIDWQDELNNEGSELEKLNTQLTKDSNSFQ